MRSPADIGRRRLRIQREDDLPGSEAPAAWLAWLRGGSARNLRRVGGHDHQDVVTLARLFQRLVQAEAEERAAPPAGCGPRLNRHRPWRGAAGDAWQRLSP